MDIKRLRKIIQYGDCHKEEMEEKIRSFCSFAGISNDKELLNIMQIVRPSFQKKGYLIIELPFCDQEIGALCYKGDALGYIVLNTSLPKVNVNFALCHELYHVLYQKTDFRTKVEFANDDHYTHEEEVAANLFAGLLLMPTSGFRCMFQKFHAESENNERDTVFRLMNYYQVPYMAVLVRCFELELLEESDISKMLLEISADDIKNGFSRLWLDESILNPSYRDDYDKLEYMVKRYGEECMEGAYLNERTLKKVLQNMKRLYREVRGE